MGGRHAKGFPCHNTVVSRAEERRNGCAIPVTETFLSAVRNELSVGLVLRWVCAETAMRESESELERRSSLLCGNFAWVTFSPATFATGATMPAAEVGSLDSVTI